MGEGLGGSRKDRLAPEGRRVLPGGAWRGLEAGRRRALALGRGFADSGGRSGF